MILVDVGNTNLNFCLAKDNRFLLKRQIPSDRVNTKILLELLSVFSPDKEIIVCSVVPDITRIFTGSRFRDKYKVRVIGRDIRVPIKCEYNHGQVGNDRLTAAFAVKTFFLHPRIVIDCGSAITFDFLSSEGIYLGGFISPGVRMSLSSLSRCALLPDKVRIERESASGLQIPKNTKQSMLKGVLQGNALLLDSWVNLYRKWINRSGRLKKTNIIITGGDAGFLLGHLNFPYTYDPDLIFKGMSLLTGEK